MNTIPLLWQLYKYMPPEHYGALAEWHLWGVLGLLGVLAAVGLHYLIGHVFRFYRIAGRPSSWLAAPTFPVLLIGLFSLLGTYLLGMGAQELAWRALETAESIPQPSAGENALGQVLPESTPNPRIPHSPLEPLPPAERVPAPAPGPSTPGATQQPPAAELAPFNPIAKSPPAPLTAQIGRLLLAPAFDAAHDAEGEEPTRAQIAAAIQAIASEDLRLAYQAPSPEPVPGIAPAGAGPPEAIPAGARPPAANPAEERVGSLLLAMVRLWLTDTGQSWPTGLAIAESRGAADSDGQAPFLLGEFVPALIGEIGEDDALPRIGWEHVAGTRFVEYVLQPLLTEYFVYSAVTAAALVLLIMVAYLAGLMRLRRWADRRAMTKSRAKSKATLPAIRTEPAPPAQPLSAP
ncbi:MAG: hypothetical protein IID61_00635 [SAR324 cluster bacterium]|nr:hypothetical protein [SAR324 cluster bacterium]